MKQQNLIKIFSILCGIVFLISGIGKSLSIAGFSNLIALYGFKNFGFVAPVIVWAEIIIGLALVLRCYPKQFAFTAILFLIAVTCIYVYGYFRHHITDCGCFGAVSKLNNMPPSLIVIRNLLLIALLYVVWKYAEKNQNHLAEWKTAIIICVISVFSFFAGYSYYPPFIRLSEEEENTYEGKALADTPLNDFLATSADSTYLVYVFSYTCPHCLNSIENLKQYKKVADRIIALAVRDSVYEPVFRQNFQVDFAVKNYDYQAIQPLAKGFPTAYYIQNDTIKKEIIGELPCVYNFKKMCN